MPSKKLKWGIKQLGKLYSLISKTIFPNTEKKDLALYYCKDINQMLGKKKRMLKRKKKRRSARISSTDDTGDSVHGDLENLENPNDHHDLDEPENLVNENLSNPDPAGGLAINVQTIAPSSNTTESIRVARQKTRHRVNQLDIDGCSWRKYGSKIIKDEEYPRDYYKCGQTGCSGKIQVHEDEDGNVIKVIRDGKHTCKKPAPAYDGSGTGPLEPMQEKISWETEPEPDTQQLQIQQAHQQWLSVPVLMEQNA